MAAVTRIRTDVFECLGFMRFTASLGPSVIIEASWSEDCRSISDVGKFDASLPRSRCAFHKIFGVKESHTVHSRRCRFDPIAIETCETKVLLVLPIPTPKIRP